MEKSNGITKMKIRPPVKATKISSHVHSSLSLSHSVFSRELSLGAIAEALFPSPRWQISTTP